MTDKIKSTDVKADIDFYRLGASTDGSGADLNLERLKDIDAAHLANVDQSALVNQAGFKITWGVWLLFFAALSFVVFNGYSLGVTVLEAYHNSPALAAVMALSALGFIGLLGYGITKEVVGFLNLKQLDCRVDLEGFRMQNNLDDTLKALKQRARMQQKSATACAFNQRFFASVQAHHSNADVIDMYTSNVEEPLLRKAQAIVKQEALRSGGVTFISPNEFIQTLALLWTNLRVLRIISQLYGVRPGVVGNVKLLGMMWQNVLLQNATDVLAEQLLKDVSHKFLGTIAEKAGIAATSGGLTVRLGLQLIKHLSLIK